MKNEDFQVLKKVKNQRVLPFGKPSQQRRYSLPSPLSCFLPQKKNCCWRRMKKWRVPVKVKQKNRRVQPIKTKSRSKFILFLSLFPASSSHKKSNRPKLVETLQVCGFSTKNEEKMSLRKKNFFLQHRRRLKTASKARKRAGIDSAGVFSPDI